MTASIKNKIVIRPALPEDIGAPGAGGIRDIFNAVRRYEHKHGRSPLSPPQYGAWVQAMRRQSDGQERFQVLVAEGAGGIVGFCLATHLEREASATLNKIFVAPDLHRAGLGRKFVAAVRARALRLGKTEINVSAESGPGRASGFYRRLGFRVVETMDLHDGVKKDRLRLVLRAGA